jgi:hypothetical protein
MQVKLAFAILGIVGCAAPPPTAPFHSVLRGEVAQTPTVAVLGRVDTTGVNFYSLFDVAASVAGTDCIALLLTDRDRRRAKLLDGKQVRVRGKMMFQADLDQILPSQSGEIDGRKWSGTRCTGETVLYVTKIERIR